MFNFANVLFSFEVGLLIFISWAGIRAYKREKVAWEEIRIKAQESELEEE